MNLRLQVITPLNLNQNDLVFTETEVLREFWYILIELRRPAYVDVIRSVLTQNFLHKLLIDTLLQTLNIKVLVAIAELEERLESRILHM